MKADESIVRNLIVDRGLDRPLCSCLYLGGTEKEGAVESFTTERDVDQVHVCGRPSRDRHGAFLS